MTGVATFNIPPTFLGIDRDDPGLPICVAGGTVSGEEQAKGRDEEHFLHGPP